MWIQKIALKNYRNYLNNELEFSPGLNVFIGKNAQGKTNFLEAIYFLSLTRSHRTRLDKELIHFQEKELRVSGNLQRSSGTVPLKSIYQVKDESLKLITSNKRNYLITSGNDSRLFAPEDLQLIKGAPSLRRKFIDIDLGQIKPVYLSDLSNYNHVLKQRNTYLKTAEKVDIDFLAVLDEQLADFGSRVMEHRLDFIANLEKEADRYHYTISDGLEHLKIHYLSSVPFDKKSDIKEQFLKTLEKSQA